MKRVPIRLRLTLVFTAAMAVVLAAMGIFVYSLVASDLSDALDREGGDRGCFRLRSSSYGGQVVASLLAMTGGVK